MKQRGHVHRRSGIPSGCCVPERRLRLDQARRGSDQRAADHVRQRAGWAASSTAGGVDAAMTA